MRLVLFGVLILAIILIVNLILDYLEVTHSFLVEILISVCASLGAYFIYYRPRR
jgi:hypothetical protein